MAADNVNIVKLLPALISGQEEIDYFVAALDDVLQDAHKGSGLLFEFGRTMAKGAFRKSGKLRPDAPYTPPSSPENRGLNGNAGIGNGHGIHNGNGLVTAAEGTATMSDTLTALTAPTAPL